MQGRDDVSNVGWQDAFGEPDRGLFGAGGAVSAGGRARFVLLGIVADRPLVVVVADDQITDATLLISVYEPDEEHGWTPQTIGAILGDDRREEGP